MATEDIKKAIAELMRELQKGEDSAKEKGYIRCWKDHKNEVMIIDRYPSRVAIFFLSFNHCTKAEKSDRETEGNHGRLGWYRSCQVAYTYADHHTRSEDSDKLFTNGR